MIYSELILHVCEGPRERVLDILRSLISPIQATPGCLGCRMYQDVDELKTLALMSYWRDRGSHMRHLASPLYGRILIAIEESSEPPEVRFCEVQCCEGMEAIEQARRSDCRTSTKRSTSS